MHFQWTSLALVAAAALQATTSEALPANMISCLQAIKGKSYLITPSSSNYTQESLTENYIFNYKPQAIFHPATNNDVSAAIKCASAANVAIAPRSGGHSFEGYSAGGQDGSLIIDLNQFNQFSVDKKTNIATIGGGNRLGPIYAKLWANGQYLIPAGTCPTVGIGGHALGGGVGMTSRKYGILSDNIVSMTVVDPSGAIKTASASENTDLYWALRGAGGGSFGVVTEFRIQAYKPPSKVTSMTLDFPLSKYSTVLDAYAAFGATASEDLMAEMNLDTSGNMQVQVVYLGNKADANKAVASLLKATGKPKSSDIREGKWIDAAVRFAWMQNSDLANPKAGDSNYAKGRSLVYRQALNKKEKDVIYKYLTAPPKGISAAYLIVDLWGGKIKRPASESAFVHHDAVIGIEFVTEWGDAGTKPGKKACGPCQTWSLNFYKEMLAAYTKGQRIEAYQNYIDKDLPNSMDAYYGKALPRLKTIKKSVDPNNVFRFPQSIPLN
ncbi:hypothetical protein BGZ93_004272 [Podila epicladia]|nr:hypothetical protein BGZ93_004272 [Podila epicladia]